MNKLGYPDLESAFEVYRALLGYGMFAEKLPPCFSSEQLLQFKPPQEESNKSKGKNMSHVSVSYSSSRNTGTSRQIGIPHPEPYFQLCKAIELNWKDINEHIGKPKDKFNFCHVREIGNHMHIFEMNYEGTDRWYKENLEQGYYLGCSHVVSADISTCFPSIYTHAIPWAAMGKEKAKKAWKENIKNRRSKKNKENLKHWSENLDEHIRNCNDQQTSGILIGPHTSNIISEIILTRVDCELQKLGYKKVIRYIDDYTYFANDEIDARNFLKQLELILKNYELLLNTKKTKIVTLTEYFSDNWPSKLSRFNFPMKEEFGHTTIDAYLDYAISLSKAENNLAAITYAIKSIAKKKLSARAKNLYARKMLSLVILYPYLLPWLDDFVLTFVKKSIAKPAENSPILVSLNTPGNDQVESFLLPDYTNTYIADSSVLTDFLCHLFNSAIKNNQTDALAFVFYFALKYKVKLHSAFNKSWRKEVIKLHDCISMLLAWKYCADNKLSAVDFDNEIQVIQQDERLQDQFWLFIYEHAKTKEDIPPEQVFLRSLKEQQISFIEFKNEIDR